MSNRIKIVVKIFIRNSFENLYKNFIIVGRKILPHRAAKSNGDFVNSQLLHKKINRIVVVSQVLQWAMLGRFLPCNYIIADFVLKHNTLHKVHTINLKIQL